MTSTLVPSIMKSGSYRYPIYQKKRKLSKLEFLDIIEIDANPYYYLIRNKDNKLFSIIISEIYSNLISYLIK